MKGKRTFIATIILSSRDQLKGHLYALDALAKRKNHANMPVQYSYIWKWIDGIPKRVEGASIKKVEKQLEENREHLTFYSELGRSSQVLLSAHQRKIIICTHIVYDRF